MVKASLMQKDGLASCETCLKEVPVSETKSEEASDYVAHFFGLECYAMWKAKGSRRKLLDK